MISILIPFILCKLVLSQMGIMEYPELPSYSLGHKIFAVEINDNGNGVFNLVNATTSAKVIRLNVTDRNNITYLGEYVLTYSIQSSTLNSIYIVKDYLIVTISSVNNPVIFNLTSYQQIGIFNSVFFI